MKTIEFRIKELETTQFAVFEIPEDSTLSNFSLKMDCAFGADHEKHELGCRLAITISSENVPAIKIETSVIYELSEKTFSDFISGNKLLIPKEIAAFFVAKLFDTIRGQLFERLSQTRYSKFILPSINIREFVNAPLEISLDAATLAEA